MRLRALVPCALIVLAGAPAARAADHPVGPWPTCCSGPTYTDVVADSGDTVTITGDFADHPLAWAFDDFTTESAGPSRTYAFAAAGTYPFHCTIHSYMHGVVKVGSDQHAAPDFTVSSTSPTTSDAVTFTYTGTADPDGTIASYEWDFNGDGSTDQTTTADHVSHTYPSAGTFHPTVRVRDNGHELSDPAPAKTVAVTAAPDSQGGAGPTSTGGSTGNTAPGGAGGQDAGGASGADTADTTAPTAAHVRVSGGRLRFVLSEDASLRATLRRAGRPVRQLGVALKAGRVAYRLPRRLKPGRYTIRFVLTDAAGNHSRTYGASFRVT